MQLTTILILVTAIVQPSLLSADSTAESISKRDNTVGNLTEVNQRFLTQIARRTLASGLRNETPYVPKYIPPALNSFECQIVATLRQSGYTRGIGVSVIKPIVEACQEAANLAGISANIGDADVDHFLDTVRIDLQLLGEPQPYTSPIPWTEPGALDDFVVPGVDGLRLALDGEQRWFTPSEMISKNLSLKEALNTLSKEICLDPKELPRSRLSKFTTIHWIETGSNGEIVNLHRGMSLISPDEVSRNTLTESIKNLCRFIVFRQQPNGRFAFEYCPATDAYFNKDNETAQSGAARALAYYSSHVDAALGQNEAAKAINWRLENRIEIPNSNHGSFISAKDSRNNIAITAQMCLALADFPELDRFSRERNSLAHGILWLQVPSGQIASSFPPLPVSDSHHRYSSQAVLALARCYELAPSSELFNALSRAYNHYSEEFSQSESLALAAWQVQAFAIMAKMTKRRDFTDYVFKMSDKICEFQLTAENNAYPEMWGAFFKPQSLSADSSTAVFVSALADAADLARKTGDVERYKRYSKACSLGARFILQLQFKADECYYVRSTHDTVNGIRSSPTSVRINIASCHHALIALIKTRNLLFPE